MPLLVWFYITVLLELSDSNSTARFPQVRVFSRLTAFCLNRFQVFRDDS